MNITCKNGSQIICEGMDNPEKIKSIVGITDVWIEEANELTYDDYKQLNLRMRGGNLRKRMILSLNPVSKISWVYEHFFKKPKDNTITHHTTHQDNKFLDDEYRLQLEQLADVDQYFHKVYTLGEWGVLGNLVFNNYVIEDFQIELEEEFFGMDFGYNHASVMVAAGLYDGELYVPKELYVKQKTNTEFATLGEFWDPDYKSHIYTADAAEPDRIKEFNDRGWCVEPAQKGKDSVKHGIDFLKRYRIHIHKDCPNLANEIQQYKYRETRDGQVLDEPVAINDDCIAALRYASEYLWRNTTRWRPVA
jgi:phage terminase large subunit